MRLKRWQFSPWGPVLRGMITDVLIKGRAPAAETLADRFLVQAAVLPISVQKWVLRQDSGQASEELGIVLEQESPQQSFTKLSGHGAMFSPLVCSFLLSRVSNVGPEI